MLFFFHFFLYSNICFPLLWVIWHDNTQFWLTNPFCVYVIQQKWGNEQKLCSFHSLVQFNTIAYDYTSSFNPIVPFQFVFVVFFFLFSHFSNACQVIFNLIPDTIGQFRHFYAWKSKFLFVELNTCKSRFVCLLFFNCLFYFISFPHFLDL